MEKQMKILRMDNNTTTNPRFKTFKTELILHSTTLAQGFRFVFIHFRIWLISICEFVSFSLRGKTDGFWSNKRRSMGNLELGVLAFFHQRETFWKSFE